MCPDAPDNETRCAQCPLTRLDDAFAGPAGDLLSRVLDIEFALSAGVSVTLSDMTTEEFQVLRLVQSERKRYRQSQQQG